MKNEPQDIDTDRLHMRPLTLEDAWFIRQLHDDEMIRHYHFKNKPLDDEKIASELKRWTDILKKWGHAYHLIFEKGASEEDGFVGKAAIWRLEEFTPQGQIEIGYLIVERHRRKGFATEVADALTEYVFNVLDSDIAVALIEPENEISKRVAERVGYVYEETTVMAARSERDVDVYRRYRDDGVPSLAHTQK